MHDLIIIGMGISGITAGIYAKRKGLDILMLEKGAIGGALQEISTINNYPGYENITGPDLAMNLFNQVKSLGIPYKNEEVISLENGDIKKVITNKNTYECKNIIIATGRKPKYLGLDNETDYLGKGLSTCASCDGYFYKGENIAVVGSGNSSLQESLYLANIVNKVYLIHRNTSFKADEALIKEVESKKNIEIIGNVTVEKINEKEGKIESILLSNNQTILVKGIFIYVGFRPNTDFINNLDIKNIEGSIITDNECKSKLDGIYAIGDCRKKEIYQLVTAASDGAIAVSNIK